jgi:hypothetical protein
MREVIAKAVQIYRNNPALDENEIFKLLVAETIDGNVANQLCSLLPLAYNRALFDDIGARFSESYLCIDKYGRLSPEQPLPSIPLWNEIVTYVELEIEKGITIRDLLAIACFSSEYNAIMQMIQKESKVSDCILSPPIFLPLDADPMLIKRVLQSQHEKLKSMHKKWWQFWR